MNEYFLVEKQTGTRQIIGPGGSVLLTDCCDVNEVKKLIELANKAVKNPPRPFAYRTVENKLFTVCPNCKARMPSRSRYCHLCSQEIKKEEGSNGR